MKIRKLTIAKYKVLDTINLDFTDSNNQTLNAIVIAGLNGSGKTTILELLKDILAGEVIKNVHKNFAITIEFDFGGPKWYKHLLEAIAAQADDFECQFTITGTHLTLHYEHAKTRKAQVHIFREFMDFFKAIQEQYKQTTTIIYRYSHDKIKGKRRNTQNDILHEVSFNTHKKDMKDLILKPISAAVFKNRNTPPKDVIDSEINGINKIFEGLHLHSRFIDITEDELIFRSPNGDRIFFDDLSSGEKFVYFMGFLLKRLTVNHSIILIDEPEDSLHPTWQSHILQFYSNIGTNNQVIFATHSPHIIGAVQAENVFLLRLENETIVVSQPKYSQGHSIAYVLAEIMDTDYRNTLVNNTVEEYLNLIKQGAHETEQGRRLWAEIEKLSPDSEERMRVNFSLRRFKAIGK